MSGYPNKLKIKSPDRYSELDLWRGMTVVVMVIYHIYLITSWWYQGEAVLFDNPFRKLISIIPVSFLLLVGIGLHLKYHQTDWKTFWHSICIRCGKLASIAILISLTTWLLWPSMPIYFGIIHLIAITSFIGAWLVWSRVSSGVLVGVSLIIMGNGVVFAEAKRGDWWLMPLGIRPTPFSTLDYFPLFPWLGVVLLGIVLGRWLYPDRQSRFLIRWSQPFLRWIGQRALLIYVIHAPIIWLTLQIISLV